MESLNILILSGEQMCILIRISANSMFCFFVRSVSNGFGGGVVHSDYNAARVQKPCCKYIKNNETVIGQSEITINTRCTASTTIDIVAKLCMAMHIILVFVWLSISFRHIII